MSNTVSICKRYFFEKKMTVNDNDIHLINSLIIDFMISRTSYKQFQRLSVINPMNTCGQQMQKLQYSNNTLSYLQ